MFQQKTILFPILFLLLVGCEEVSRPELVVNSCLIEVDKRWQWESPDRTDTVYKLIKAQDDEYDVGVFQGNGMFYLGRKPASYFNETGKFKFEPAPCPGNKDQKRHQLKDTIKEIEIKTN
jgi:hypothetical protein